MLCAWLNGAKPMSTSVAGTRPWRSFLMTGSSLVACARQLASKTMRAVKTAHTVMANNSFIPPLPLFRRAHVHTDADAVAGLVRHLGHLAAAVVHISHTV